jgi:hypothetical protein
MDETPIFASVERDLEVTYDDLADPAVDPGAAGPAEPGSAAATRP